MIKNVEYNVKPSRTASPNLSFRWFLDLDQSFPRLLEVF